MRLTSIKLSGFKSFVDPTTISLPGQLIGIVGPNGCGKSNVIDAVRWVLGESKASALRGESMEDVIFNGAGERKPVSRASVELVFDNSAGRAVGPWSQYAELSVKRVLQRDVGSSYYINNQPVRRRDILDVFLGTGLGPRAYAVIEQGMISRIIEAKPEELRIFLEEAAGVSRYKERRRETESRLADTRENLARVQDIQSELTGQLERLEAQAKVAARYRELEQARHETQALLLGQRREDALRTRETAIKVLAEAETQLYGKEAELAALANQVEQWRQASFASNDALHSAQGAFYEVNAEVSRVEQQIQFERERVARIAQLIQEAEQRERALSDEAIALEQALAEAHDAVAVGHARYVEHKDAVEAASLAVPAAEAALRAAAHDLAETQQRLSQIDAEIQVAQVKKNNAERSLQQFEIRRQRLEQERERLNAPEDEELNAIIEQIQSEQEELEAAEQAAQEAEELASEADRTRASRREAAELVKARHQDLRARHEAIAKLQRSFEHRSEGDLANWLERHGLRGTPLWRALKVEAGWDDAIEAILRERLHALPLPGGRSLLELGVPPTRLTLYHASAGHASGPAADAADALALKVRSDDPGCEALVRQWLKGYRCVPDLATALARRAELAEGEHWITPAGHVLSQHAVSYFAPEEANHGALSRQRELDQLHGQLLALEQESERASTAAASADKRYQELRTLATQRRTAIVSVQRRVHALEVERLQLEQARARAQERTVQIEAELAEIAAHMQTEKEHASAQLEALAELEARRNEALTEREHRRGKRSEADVALVKSREALRAAENALRDAMYAEKLAQDRVAELTRRLEANRQQVQANRAERERLAAEQASILLTPLETQLQGLLGQRQEREAALKQAREAVEQAQESLRQSDEQRLVLEREFEPVRKRIEEARIRQSTAEAALAQLDEQLQHLKVDPEWLSQRLPEAPRPASLQASLTRIENDMQQLGAVNLAALEELEQARERKLYLDAQASDLSEAIATLEDAIRRIDRDTRQQLQQTYDQVNTHFGRLFPTLFGGGQAKLVLTGDEILDAGIQVVAQPPGKRNSSIHLLSGGEKALTATALVFALFHLNPAPFCLLDEVDAPLDDPNTERFCRLVRQMSAATQFLFISHNKITMEMAEQLIGVTMQEPGVSRIVGVDVAQAIRMAEAA